MILQWTQSLLQFLLWYAVASIGGCISYWLLRLTPLRSREIIGKFAVLVIALCCLYQPIFVLALALLVLLPSFASAFCEKAMDDEGKTWSAHLGISILTYLLSIPLNMAVLQLVSEYGKALVLSNRTIDIGLLLGFMLTPAAISLFRWIVHNSGLRPGIDRHLVEGELADS